MNYNKTQKQAKIILHRFYAFQIEGKFIELIIQLESTLETQLKQEFEAQQNDQIFTMRSFYDMNYQILFDTVRSIRQDYEL